jgi:GT2 family glycosyltransferase
VRQVEPYDHPARRGERQQMTAATVVIVTKNRKDELRIAVQSAIAQSATPEIIVIDDGSDDGTEAMVQSQFPMVRIVRHATSRGYVVRRNEGARLAAGAVVFSIDDDAEFTSARTVAQTLSEFDDSRIGAVAVPFVEPNKSPQVLQQSPDAGRWVTDCFIGTAHAVRRDLFVALGGYRERLVHQGEERDYCIRLLASGHVVRLGGADPIQHHESARRDFRRMDYYGRRNDVLFAWHYVPMPWLPGHMAGTMVNALRTAWRVGRGVDMLRGTVAGLIDTIGHRHERTAIAPAVYRLHRALKKQGPHAFDRIVPLLPPATGDLPPALMANMTS